MVPAAAIALERLLVRRRELAVILLNADMFDRWGPKEGPECDAMMAAGAAAQKEHAEVTVQLRAQAIATGADEPDAVRAWAVAHVDLLERFIKACADDPDLRTSGGVAADELRGWREVATGASPFVDENCYYVRVDPAEHARWFGGRS